MRKTLQANRAEIEKSLGTLPGRFYFSPATYGQWRTLAPLLRDHVHGKVIDLGCGSMPFRESLPKNTTAYHTLDLHPRSVDVTYAADIQDMWMIAEGSYDTALCFETLEHVPDPFRAAHEIYRILRPGAKLLMSVPHLSRLHDEPHDYYRFTSYGLRHLLSRAGFVVLEIHRRGGLVSFLGHQVSSVFLSAAWSVTALRKPAWFVNKWLVTKSCYWLDRLLDRSDVFALGFVAVAQKPVCGTPEELT